jgi:hypothetical protein
VAEHISVVETMVFNVIEGLLLIVRFLAIIYFMVMAYRHFRVQKDQRDMYTFYSFVFLALSLILFFGNRMSRLLEDSIIAFYQDDPDMSGQIKSWIKNNDTLIRVVRGILRPGLGYLFQSVAFLINIERWSVILAGGSTAGRQKALKEEKIKLVSGNSSVPLMHSPSNGGQVQRDRDKSKDEEEDEDPEDQRIEVSNPHLKFIVKLVLLSIISLILFIWYTTRFPHFDLGFFIIQGLLIDLYLFFSYIDIYRRFRAYHEGVLATFG